jgi:tRNA(Ile)-lysidine synthase
MISPIIEFNADQDILVSFSCGPDSVSLVHLLLLNGVSPNRLFLLYFDHGLRASEIKKERSFIQSFSTKLGLNYDIRDLPVRSESEKKGISLEMAGRELRYKSLVEYAKSNSISTVLTAHHKNDSAESILLKLFRGTRLLTSPIKSQIILEGVTICYRPLLNCLKSELISFLIDNNHSYCVDSSNSDIQFKRNLIRSMAPSFKEINSGYVDHFIAFSSYQNKVDEYFCDKIEGLDLSIGVDGYEILLSSLGHLHPLELEYALLSFLKEVGHTGYILNTTHINTLSSLILKKQPGSVSLAENFEACVTTSRLVFKTNNFDCSFLVKLKSVPGTISIPELNKKINFSVIDPDLENCRSTSNTAYLNSDFITDVMVTVRSFEIGDSFQPFGMTNSKKLSDYFIDKKIDRLNRRRVPLFFVDNQLAWVGGYQISNLYRITPDTKKVLKIKMTTHD